MSEPELFSCGGERYIPAHVLAVAAFWGELDGLYVESLQRVKALKRAQTEGVQISDDDLQARSEAFRRHHGLRTARATESWMATRGVTVSEFSDFLEREALRGYFKEAPSRSRKDPARDAGAVAYLWPDAVFTGLADDWCQRLAVRAAAAREVAEDGGIPASLFDTGGEAAARLIRWLERFGLGEEWFERLRALDAAYTHFATSVQTPSQLDAALRARWERLFAVDLEIGGFNAETAAREASLCVSEDGASFDEICREGGGLLHRGPMLLGDLPDAMRTQALSLPVGSLLPVFAWDGRFIVCRILAKSEPSMSEARVRDTVVAAVLDEAVVPLLKRHITWPHGAAR